MTNLVKQNTTQSLATCLKQESVKAQFANALGKHADSFISSLVSLHSSDDRLRTCDQNEIIRQALKAACMNLSLVKSLGHAYLYTFNTTVTKTDANGREIKVKVPTPTLVIGYKGYIQLAIRTGMYEIINANVVYDGMRINENVLTGEIEITGSRKSNTVIGYVGYFRLKSGYSHALYMSVEDMADYAMMYAPNLPKGTTRDVLINKAQSNADKGVGWTQNFRAMALKTIIRQLIGKYGFLTVEMNRAFEEDSNVSDSQDNIEDADIVDATEVKAIGDAAPAAPAQVEEPVKPATIIPENPGY